MSWAAPREEGCAGALKLDGCAEPSAGALPNAAPPALPHPADPVAHWFEPLLAQRLAQADMPTLGALAQRIEAAGARWWYPVRGMGVLRASRVVQWLHEQPGALGLRQEPGQVDDARASKAQRPSCSAAGAGRITAPAAAAAAASQPHDWTRQLRALQPVEH